MGFVTRMKRIGHGFAVALAVLSSACPKPGGGGGQVNPRRCEVDLKATGLFAQDGTGASAKRVESAEQLIGGPNAWGRVGDTVLQNDKVRVIIEQPGRTIGPVLSGGAIVDADLVRPAGAEGKDAFGRMGLFYALGRLSSVTDVEIISDGSSGGPAIVASSGKDVPHDLLNLQLLITNVAGLPVTPIIDPSKPVNARLTTYYVLSPGESRVRMLTAMCNDGDSTVRTPLIELMDVGAFELFNPGGCQNGIGNSKLDDTNCLADKSKWIGSQGDGVAYALRTMQLKDPTKVSTTNAVIGYGGVVGTVTEAENLQGILAWFDEAAPNRPGAFVVLPKEKKLYLRDFIVAKDLAGISDVLSATEGEVTGTADVTVQPAGEARVSFVDVATDKMVTLAVTDAAGKAQLTLPPGNYRATATKEGATIGAPVTFSITQGQPTPVALTQGTARTLSVTVKNLSNAPVPAKVTVFCSPSPCPFNAATYKQHLLVDPPEMGAALVGFVPISGQLSLALPPGEYEVVVSRGPEYSTWPDTWPTRGAPVDLRTADGSVSAVVDRVVDSPGWVSADLHVHAIQSSDSAVLNELRAANFLAEGMDVLLSTDHEVITDFAPVVRSLGAEHLMATMIGEEVTSFSHGHFNTFPLKRNPDLPNGGAFDHAGGEDAPTLRMPAVFSGIKAEHPGAVVQLNHPRGGSGVLTQLKVDTTTLASHGDPAAFQMAPAPDATANDTKLFGDGFDLIESANGTSPSKAVLNDWMTFLSRGTVRTASGVSDTHKPFSDSPGYCRTYAKVAGDTADTFQPGQFAEAVRTQQIFVTNGPYLQVTARKLDQAMQPVGNPVGIGGTLSVAANDPIELTVDVQGPEWMSIDTIEVFAHTTGREALNGDQNGSWPDARALERKTLPAMAPVEPVPGSSLRRMHLTEKLVVRTMKDNWLVVMVRGTSRSMKPLHGDLPVAYSNAILVDADGSGRYDDFPLKPGQPLSVPPRPAPSKRVPTVGEFGAAIRKLIEHRHD